MRNLEPPDPVAAVESGLPPGADALVDGSFLALQRAALRARLVAQQTGTDLILVRNGQLVRESPFEDGTLRHPNQT